MRWSKPWRQSHLSAVHKYENCCGARPNAPPLIRRSSRGFDEHGANEILLDLPYLPRLFFLGFFHDDYLVGVTHALPLIGLRLAICAYVRCHLTNLLLIHSLDNDFRLTRCFHFNALGHFMGDGMGESQGQV